MILGKAVRMKRLFAHPSGRLCSIAAFDGKSLPLSVNPKQILTVRLE
jgi:hypothetical protein